MVMGIYNSRYSLTCDPDFHLRFILSRRTVQLTISSSFSAQIAAVWNQSKDTIAIWHLQRLLLSEGFYVYDSLAWRVDDCSELVSEAQSNTAKDPSNRKGDDD